MIEQHEGFLHLVVNRLLKQSALVRRFGRDEALAVGMETLWRVSQRYDESKGRFTTYAYRALRQEIFKEARRHGKLTGLEGEPEARKNRDAEIWEDIVDVDRILDALPLLRPRYQQAIRLRLGLDGPAHDFQDMADVFGHSRQASQQLYRHAIDALKKQLAEKKEAA